MTKKLFLIKVSLLCSRRHLNSAQVFLWEGAGWTLFLEWKNKSTSCFKFALGLVNSLHLSSLMKLTLEYILTSMNIYWPPQKHQEAWKTTEVCKENHLKPAKPSQDILREVGTLTDDTKMNLYGTGMYEYHWNWATASYWSCDCWQTEQDSFKICWYTFFTLKKVYQAISIKLFYSSFYIVSFFKFVIGWFGCCCFLITPIMRIQCG